jgi:signal transduction histidine kinase
MLGAQLLAYVVLLVLASALTTALAAYTWNRREAPGAVWLTGLLLGMAVWAGFYALGLLTSGLRLRLLWLRLNWMGSGFVPAFWLLFALAYTGRDRWVNRWTVAAVCSVPVATVLVTWSPLADPLVWQDPVVTSLGPVTLLQYDSGSWYAVFDVYTYALIGVATLLLAEMVVRQRGLYADQAVALMGGSFMPAVGYLLSALDVLRAGIDVTPLTFPVTGAAFAYVIFRGRLLDRLTATPEIGRDVAVDTMQDGVVVVDHEGVVIEHNPAAVDLLGGDGEATGETLSALLGDVPVALDGSESTARFQTPDGTRHLEATVSPITDVHDRSIGHSIVLRDVTERRSVRQRLSVSNRVLRHNLRNDLSVVLTHADAIRETTERATVADSAATIEAITRRLVDTGQKARTVEQLLDEDAEPVTVDLADLTRRAASSVDDDTPTDVDTDVPESVPVRALPGLGTAIEELVANAVEHGEPPVAVTVDGDGDWAELRVADAGPGVPEHERRVLGGDETSLEHASGVGLWLVTWLVERSGGELSFFEGDRSGVTVRLRRATTRAGRTRDVSA